MPDVSAVDRMSRPAYGLVETDLNGVYLYANLEFAAILNRPLEDILGRPAFDFIAPDKQMASRNALSRNMAGGAAFTYEVSYLRPDDTIVSVIAHVGMLRDPDGSPLRLFGVIQRLPRDPLVPVRAVLPPHDPGSVALRIAARARALARDAADIGAPLLKKILAGAAREAEEVERRARRVPPALTPLTRPRG